MDIDEKLQYFAGIDMGGTFVKCGIADENGNLLCKEKIDTGRDRPYEDVVRDIANLVRKLEKQANVEISAVGMGIPGTIDSENGVVVYSNNFNWFSVPFGKTLSEELQKPVYCTNDANSAALGEAFVGEGKKYSSIVFITLGTGVGGGIIIDKKLFEGNKSAGAEIGHTVVRVGGEKCTCGRKGCLEAYASATGLIKYTKGLMVKDKTSELWNLCQNNIDNLNGKIIFDGVKLGDKLSKKALNHYVKYLSEGVTNFINIFRPEAVMLGGGISEAGDVLLKPVKAKVNKLMYGGNKYAPVKIITAKSGNDAGLLGGVCLAKTKMTEIL